MNEQLALKLADMRAGKRVTLTDSELDILEAARVEVRTCYHRDALPGAPDSLGRTREYVAWTEPAAEPSDLVHRIYGAGRMVAFGSL